MSAGHGWEECRAAARAACGEDHLLAGFMGTGIFEQCHFLMGFEGTLTALYEHPDEMHELIEYITQYRLDYVRRLIDGLQPDVIFSHDDWGTKAALFMKPDMWREFFKEPYRRFYGYIRSRGVIAIHHADSYLAPIVDDMAEIGIQVWQGVLPENDIPALQRHLKGRLVLMGGLGAAIDRVDAQPDEILAYARSVLERYCPGGHYIPSITYGLAGTVFPHVDQYLDQAIDEYNAGLHFPVTPLPPIPRRQRAAAPAAAQAAQVSEGSGDLMARISSALLRGQQKRVLQLCQQALDEGYGPQEILSEGSGPRHDRSGGGVLRQPGLCARRCSLPPGAMTAATALLKPLYDRRERPDRRSCVPGHRPGGHARHRQEPGEDHDGGQRHRSRTTWAPMSSPQQFIDTAKKYNCGIIACSSLLTTTMQNMRQVVELSKQEGIRDKVKIMVGGAPIDQSFCDEIGADVYTEDAAAAARAAVDILQGQQPT